MMRIRPLAAATKLSRGLFDQLADEIKSGRLAPGERLPTEAELTRAARVSRTVVREAVAALRAEGRELHRASAEATGNPEFARFLQFIGRHLIPRRIVSGLPETMGGRRAYLELIPEEHRRIYEAIRSRDPKAAREAMRRHLTRS